MKKLIIFEEVDGNEIAIETVDVRKFETTGAPGRCYMYYWDPGSEKIERICVIGKIKDLVSQVNMAGAEDNFEPLKVQVI